MRDPNLYERTATEISHFLNAQGEKRAFIVGDSSEFQDVEGRAHREIRAGRRFGEGQFSRRLDLEIGRALKC
jgi:hypothetical protein